MHSSVILTLVWFHTYAGAFGSAVIESSLQNRLLLKTNPNVLVSFTENIQTIFEQINHMKFSALAEKRTALTNAQEKFSNKAQEPLQKFLSDKGVKYETFWISNSMVVFNVDSSLVQSISRVSGVAKIEEEPVVQIVPIGGNDDNTSIGKSRDHSRDRLSWGITKIRADKVWSSYNGTGIVVAGIDTGVRYTHEALKSNWRKAYGWFDPYRSSSTPSDRNGHGTHTMGTIAGSNGIGVAPGVNWIACKGCENRVCPAATLLKCGQWVQCPTKPDGSFKDCNQAPDVVSNSWGEVAVYNDMIKSWRIAGIIPVFSAGNSGPSCSTTKSPAEHPEVIAVGSTDVRDAVSSFSSRGPGSDGRIKPDIVAPGSEILSASNKCDSCYKIRDGTSMACPHVSGLVALMLQKKTSATYDEIYKAITKGAARNTLDTGYVGNCGGISPNKFPNNVFGHGRIDAVKALQRI